MQKFRHSQRDVRREAKTIRFASPEPTMPSEIPWWDGFWKGVAFVISLCAGLRLARMQQFVRAPV